MSLNVRNKIFIFNFKLVWIIIDILIILLDMLINCFVIYMSFTRIRDIFRCFNRFISTFRLLSDCICFLILYDFIFGFTLRLSKILTLFRRLNLILVFLLTSFIWLFTLFRLFSRITFEDWRMIFNVSLFILLILI